MIKKTLVLIFSLGIVLFSQANDINSTTSIENTICSIATQQQVNPFLVALYLCTPESLEWVMQHPKSHNWLLNFCNRHTQYLNNTEIDRHWILNLQREAYNLGNFKLENFLQSITGYHIAHNPGEAEGWMW